MAQVTSAKRQIVLAAARKLFAQDGFDRVSMDALAAHAKVSKPTLYRYFKSKGDLLNGLLIEFLSSQIVRDVPVPKHAKDYRKFLIEYGMRKVDLFLSAENIVLARIFYAQMIQSADLAKTVQESFAQLAQEGLPAVFKEGERLGALYRVDIN